MRAGVLDRRITLQRQVITKDDFNADVITWQDIALVWAQVSYANAGERFTAQQKMAELNVKFKIRWMAGLTVQDAVVYEGRTYDITSIAELGRREGLEIMGLARAE